MFQRSVTLVGNILVKWVLSTISDCITTTLDSLLWLALPIIIILIFSSFWTRLSSFSVMMPLTSTRSAVACDGTVYPSSLPGWLPRRISLVTTWLTKKESYKHGKEESLELTALTVLIGKQRLFMNIFWGKAKAWLIIAQCDTMYYVVATQTIKCTCCVHVLKVLTVYWISHVAMAINLFL